MQRTSIVDFALGSSHPNSIPCIIFYFSILVTKTHTVSAVLTLMNCMYSSYRTEIPKCMKSNFTDVNLLERYILIKIAQPINRKDTDHLLGD